MALTEADEKDLEYINNIHRLWKKYCEKQLKGKKNLDEYDKFLEFYKGKMTIHIVGFMRFLEKQNPDFKIEFLIKSKKMKELLKNGNNT